MTGAGLATIVSSQADQLSYEDDAWKNGAFTEGIISALKHGKADKNKDNIITISELVSYLETSVPEMVSEVKNEIQKPKLVQNELGDISIFYIK